MADARSAAAFAGAEPVRVERLPDEQAPDEPLPVEPAQVDCSAAPPAHDSSQAGWPEVWRPEAEPPEAGSGSGRHDCFPDDTQVVARASKWVDESAALEPPPPDARWPLEDFPDDSSADSLAG